MSMPYAGEDVMREEGCSDSAWFLEFFGELHIVNTMQCLLETSKTINDLTALCVTMQTKDFVLSLTQRGLMPIASSHMYIFPYTHMNKKQLGSLRQQITQTKKSFEAVYSQDMYIVHGLSQPKIDDEIMLFGASCLVLHGLSTTSIGKRGANFSKLCKNDLLYHVNATLFHIVHACGMPAGVIASVAKLLHKHGVTVSQD